MESRRIKDMAIASLLILTLGIAGIFVSCSEDSMFINSPGNVNIGNPYLGQDVGTSTITSLFKAAAEGAASAAGGQLEGWVLSAMGIASSSGPNYSKQIGLIIADLDSIVALLSRVDSELNVINQTLLELNCSEQQSSLQTEIGAIRELYNQYNSMLATAQGGDTIPNSIMQDWSDKVLAKNSYAGQTSVGTMLSTIETNLELSSGAIYSCIRTLPLPGEKTFNLDTAYYNNVDAFTNYYYYWQTIGLVLLSEANHYYSWLSADSLGGSTYTADSVQYVCGDNGSSQFYCNEVQVETNQMYNSLLTQATFGGAPYTNEYFAFQYRGESSIVWVKSLEDFTQQAGYTNCQFPLYVAHPCGPAAGYYNTALTDTVYRGLPGLRFADSSAINNWVDPHANSAFSNTGLYLQSLGFATMAHKTIIATTEITVTFKDANKSTNVVPFFNTDMSNVGLSGTNYVVFNASNMYQWLLSESSTGAGQCGSRGMYWATTYNYKTSTYATPHDEWLNGTAFMQKCSDGSVPFSFIFQAANNLPQYPGYTITGQTNGSQPKRFLWPILYAENAKCTNGRINTNAGGMYMLCGDNFTAVLNANIPRPPTCDNVLISPACTVLE